MYNYYIDRKGCDTMKFSESNEMYLETILELHNNNQVIRVTDLANELSVSKAGVNKALKLLVSEELITKEHYGDIILTKKGIEVATSIRRKHDIITTYFLRTLDIDEEVAESNACRFEHVVSQEMLDAIEKLINK